MNISEIFISSCDHIGPPGAMLGEGAMGEGRNSSGVLAQGPKLKAIDGRGCFVTGKRTASRTKLKIGDRFKMWVNR